VYLCRHAQASPGEPDELRPLTDEGRAQAERLGTDLTTVDPAPDVVYSSPLLRARQTAEFVARALDVEVKVDERLAPGATLDDVRALASDANRPFATVGHQPDCSEIAHALTGADPGFRPGAMHALDVVD
jgi:phosphohistidine phosphatase